MRGTTLHATITIKAAPAAVLRTFQQIEGWSAWYPGVLRARWVAGTPWLPDAVMAIQVKNSLAMTVGSTATIIASADEKLIWENHAPGLITVCHAWVEPVPAGCCFTLQKFYRGVAVPLVVLLKRRQQRLLQAGLVNLRQQLQVAYHSAP